MKLRKTRNKIVLIIAAGVLALGCELIVDFDRTLIPIEGTDSGPLPTVDATIDTFQPDTSIADAADAADTSVDAADAADAADGD